MRYIGNKTKLLDFIGSVLDQTGAEIGTAFDAFAGTASVGRYLKTRGYAVSSCDLMTYSFVFQKAYVELDSMPTFSRLFGHDREFATARRGRAFEEQLTARVGGQGDLFASELTQAQPIHEVLLYLEKFIDGETSFITTHYAPEESLGTDADRMFFSRANARRIDAVRTKIHHWRLQDLLVDAEYYLLLACLLEAADAVANTTGVYAAYMKTWQSNAVRDLKLSMPQLVVGTGLGCHAYQGPVNDIAKGLGEIDLLYLDPPYNTRQYSSYYHIPEILAKGWFDKEPELRGKTGLIPDEDKKSAWSTRSGCVPALVDLLQSTNAGHILMSYNSEGIIPESEIAQVFSDAGDASTYRVFEREYARYRSDGDYDGRQYSADSVREKLYYVETAHSRVK